VRSSLRRVGSSADYPLPLNTRHAGPRQVAVGPGALRQLICDTAKVNTGAAETTRTDSHAGQLRAKAERLRRQADTALTPQPVADRLRQRAATLAELADNHDRTRIALTDEEPA
jgi:hypothetical protein